MRVADYIANFIDKNLKVDKVFLITGGGNMHLTDAIVKNNSIDYICNHHEQACAMSAVAYSKQTGKVGVVMPSTGCAGTNTITGLLDAWQDSHPCFFISGQVNTLQTCRKSSAKLRKFGTQEADILEIVKPITKYAEMIDDPQDIRYHLEKMHYLATTGRPGPVWLDVPLDIQGGQVDPSTLKGFTKKEEVKVSNKISDLSILECKRPIILAGNGIRLSGAKKEFKAFVHKFQIPVVSTYLGIDLLEGSDSLFIGRVGVKGDRAGNFALQNADLIIAIGTSLSVPVTGYNYDNFGREASLVVVDIDKEEHKKDTVAIDTFIESDAKTFFQANMDSFITGSQYWKDKCLGWKESWGITPKIKGSDSVNYYHFIDSLCKNMPPKATVIGDAGSAFYVPSQSLRLKENQRWITPGAQAEMGFTLPATVGAQVGSPESTVIGITGDGSFQFNIQELQTIKQYNLPIKLFVWNNNGYLSIKATQDKFFKGDYIGVNSDSGVSIPSIKKIAFAYDLPYVSITTNDECDTGIQDCLSIQGPVLCEVICDQKQKVLPTLSSCKQPDGTITGRPLEDMDPLLSREEFFDNMIIKPLL